MPQHIFFSWQIDRVPLTGRNLIERALGDAIAAIQADAEIDPARRELAIDRDTSGVPGSPPLVETIFAKVDAATAFLSDLTYVATRADGRRMPNPNVLLEHGWALRALSWRRVVSVMNVAHGSPDAHPLPFDLQHFRRPILYDCPDDADEGARRAARNGLATALRDALRAILNDDAAVAEQAALPAEEPHPHDIELLDKVRRQFPAGLQRYFHDHNFGEPFRRDILNPLYEMNEDWRGARFEFHDAVLQETFAEMRRLAEALANLTGKYLFALDANPALCSPKTDEDRRRGTQPSTTRAVGEMNDAATAFAGALNNFERVARDRVRVGAVAAAPAVMADRWGEARALLDQLGADGVSGRLAGIVSKPSMTIRLVPAIVAERPRLAPVRVAKAQLRFAPDVAARVATDSDGEQWWSAEVPRDAGKSNGESRWRTRLVRPGAIEYETTIGVRIDDDPDILVDGRELEGQIVAAAERLAACLSDVGLGGSALLAIGFEGMEDVELTRARGGGRPIRRPTFSLPVVELADPLAQPANLLHEAFDILWQTSGWAAGSPSFDSGHWERYEDAGEAATR